MRYQVIKNGVYMPERFNIVFFIFCIKYYLLTIIFYIINQFNE